MLLLFFPLNMYISKIVNLHNALSSMHQFGYVSAMSIWWVTHSDVDKYKLIAE